MSCYIIHMNRTKLIISHSVLLAFSLHLFVTYHDWRPNQSTVPFAGALFIILGHLDNLFRLDHSLVASWGAFDHCIFYHSLGIFCWIQLNIRNLEWNADRCCTDFGQGWGCKTERQLTLLFLSARLAKGACETCRSAPAVGCLNQRQLLASRGGLRYVSHVRSLTP